MKGNLEDEKGLLSLEASISLTIFIFLMLFLYSFFVVFEVRNTMGHCVLSTANSLSLDAYENEKLGDSDTIGQIFYNVYGQNTNGYNGFTDYRQWYDEAVQTDSYGNETISTTFAGVIKERLAAYLTGGDADEIERVLKRYHIQGGIDGIDFSKSYVSDGEVHIVVRYTVEYEFNVFGLGTIEFEQSACSKIWK